ncbi:hypothetical protein NDU88_001164 [Pleurodeles waltl]|uniref:Uncharacterized protein n=1 Tax=Pleurodeles waltl TaxID=8319 RepID=A0AAV7VYM5_PLEWA|nr:hypothetical protein NDU88_001164 [Pleurodeles waltl]
MPKCRCEQGVRLAVKAVSAPVEIYSERRGSTELVPGEVESIDEVEGQRHASAHAGKSWVEFPVHPPYRCPLRMSEPKQ